MELKNIIRFHFIGLKGSGMCALASLFHHQGKRITGSDIEDVFYTDSIIEKLGITCHKGFRPENIPQDTEMVIYSAAYRPETNAELKVAIAQYPCMTYPHALGAVSADHTSCAIVGTHGKTSTAALAGIVHKSLSLPVMSLTGGRVNDWNNDTVWVGGDALFISEVCEYRNHLQYFNANYVLLTSAELDHPDYFSHEEKIYSTFADFIATMSAPHTIIACTDTKGVRNVLSHTYMSNNATDKKIIRYGATQEASADVSLTSNKVVRTPKGTALRQFTVSGLAEDADCLQWYLPTPVSSIALNALATLILLREWMKDTFPDRAIEWQKTRDALAQFKGISRRSEVIFQNVHYVVLDDYAHHPTAIALTLAGIREFYAPKRLIVDFMSHTYTRTATLLEDFTCAFKDADVLVLNDIYASAREQRLYSELVGVGTLPHIDGALFAKEISKHHTEVHYIPDFTDASHWLVDNMREGDVLVTMGAGDNFRIAEHVSSALNVI